MRKLSAISVGLVLSCVLGLAVIAHAQPAVTTSGELPRHAGELWGKVKTATGNTSVKGIAIVVYHLKNGKMGEPVATGMTDDTGAYSIKISSLPPGTYAVRVQAPNTGALQGGITRTKLRGPTASKHLDWTLSSQSPAMPTSRWTKVQQVPAAGAEGAAPAGDAGAAGGGHE
jgi:hypothetical protein